MGTPAPHARQRPVVAPAALAQPVAVGRRGQPRHQHDVGVGDRVDAEARAGRLEQPARRRRQGAGEDRPVEVDVGAQHREQHPLAGRAQRVEQQSRPGSRSDRHVGSDGGRFAVRHPRRARARRSPPRRPPTRPANAAAGRPGSGRAASRFADRTGGWAGVGTQSAYDRSMGSKGLETARAKMQDAGVDPVAIDTFAHYYRLLEHGETGMIPESSISRSTWSRWPTSRSSDDVAAEAIRTDRGDQAQRRPRHVDGHGPREVAAVRAPRAELPRHHRPAGAAPPQGVRRPAAADLHELVPHVGRHDGRARPLRRPPGRGAAAGVPAEQGAQAARRRA